MNDLYFEELEQQEELSEWWEYVLAGGAGVGVGVVLYVVIAT